MEHFQTQYDTAEVDSRQKISYSRLADEIDQQDEENRNNKFYQECNKGNFLEIIEPLPSHRRNNFFLENQQEQPQSILDGPQIKINYCTKIQQKRQEQETKSVRITSNNSFQNKGMTASGPIKAIKPMICSKLKPITEKQSENKRSDEQAYEHRNLYESQNYNDLKTASMAPMKLTKNVLLNSKPVSTVNKVCNIRPIDDSVEIVDNQAKDQAEVAYEQNVLKRSRTQRVNHDLDNRIFSSLTTASKLAAKNVVQIKQFQVSKEEDQIKTLAQKISKMQTNILTLIGRQKGRPQNIQINQNIRSKTKTVESKKPLQSQMVRVQSIQKFSGFASIDRIKKSGDKLGNQFNFSFKELNQLIRSQLWRLIILTDAKRAEQMKNIIKKITRLLGLQCNFSIRSHEPFVVQIENKTILLISFSKKIYVGQYKIDKGYYIKHGLGIEVDPVKSIYQGNFDEGIKEGKGKFLVNQKYTYDGQWKAGMFEGKGVLRINGKSVYMGLFKNGRKNGQGIEHFQTGDIYEGQFHNNAFHGEGKYFWKNGSKYEGNFRNDEMHGMGKWTSANGDQYQGNYSNGKKEGQGMYLWRSGKKYQGQFKNGCRRTNSQSKNYYISQLEQSTSPKRYKIYFNH